MVKKATKYKVQVRYGKGKSYSSMPTTYSTKREADARATKMRKALKEMGQSGSVRVIKV